MLQCIMVPPHAESWPSGVVRFGFTSNRRSAECASSSYATHIPFRRSQRTVDTLERDLDVCLDRSLRLRAMGTTVRFTGERLIKLVAMQTDGRGYWFD